MRDFRPPDDGLFLDAIEAYLGHDYRRSILYTAMAVETAVATILDERYEQDVKTSNDPKVANHRNPTNLEEALFPELMSGSSLDDAVRCSWRNLVLHFSELDLLRSEHARGNPRTSLRHSDG
jgi:hypothetical protein